MGDGRKRVKRLLLDHPHCCLCGGVRKSETEDHLPPKAAFVSKKWPLTFVAATCRRCNNSSSVEDTVFSLVSLAFADPVGGTYDLSDVQRFARGYGNFMPAIAKRLVDNMLSRPRAQGSFVADPDHRSALEKVSRKIGKFLIYRELKTIVPSDMFVGATIFTNNEFASVSDLARAFGPFSSPQRGLKEGFNGQFIYAVSELDTGGWGVLFQMHKAFAAAVIACSAEQKQPFESGVRFGWAPVDEHPQLTPA
jgi:hypothetical protein